MEHPSVAEAAAIGVPHDIKGEVIVCFVVLKPTMSPVASDQSPVIPGELATGDQQPATQCNVLCEVLKDQVAMVLGKPMRPNYVRFVSALPKTRSAKIVRGAIRRQWLGEPLGDISTVENPQVFDEISRGGM